MTDLTLDALVEDVARAIWNADHCRAEWSTQWDCDYKNAAGPSPSEQATTRTMARAALAAVAKAAGGAGSLRGASIAKRVRVAALLDVLGEAARDVR